MTASSVASAKIEREQIEQLAQSLGVELRVSESGAGLFRRCLDRARQLPTPARATARVVMFEAETDNAGAFEALATFQRALGGTGEADATEEAERPPAPRSDH